MPPEAPSAMRCDYGTWLRGYCDAGRLGWNEVFNDCVQVVASRQPDDRLQRPRSGRPEPIRGRTRDGLPPDTVPQLSNTLFIDNWSRRVHVSPATNLTFMTG